MVWPWGADEGYVVGIVGGVHGWGGRGVAGVDYVVGSCGGVALSVQNLMRDGCRWVAVEGALLGVWLACGRVVSGVGLCRGHVFCLWWALAGFWLGWFVGVVGRAKLVAWVGGLGGYGGWGLVGWCEGLLAERGSRW